MASKILIVEDEAQARALYVKILSDIPNSEIFTAVDGNQALEIARKERPDVILMDVIMPGMSGFEVMASLQADERLRQCRVLFLSNLTSGKMGRGLNAESGVKDSLQATIDHEELLTRVKTVLRMKKMEDALRESEARFRLLTEHAQDIIFRYVVGEDPKFEYISPAVTKLLGYLPEDFYRDTHISDQLIRREDVASLVAAFSHAANENVNVRLLASHKEDRAVWLDIKMHPVFDESHAVVAIEGIARDVTEMKEAEEVLRRSESRFRGIFESGIAGFYFMKLSGEITDANDAFIEMLGYDREDFTEGRLQVSAITPPEYAPTDEKALVALLESGISPPYEKEFLRKDGTRAPVLIGGTMLGESDGISYVIDLTEKKRAEASLQEEHRHAARLEGALQTIRTLQHEINNPLQALVIILDILEPRFKTESDTDRVRFERMKEATQRIVNVVGRITQITQITRLSTIPSAAGDRLRLPGDNDSKSNLPSIEK